MNKTEIWIFAIILVLALVVVFLGVQATGNASKHTTYTQMYRSCHYVDSDMRGDCMRIERQNSNKCDPPETIPEQLTGSYNPWNRPMQWFYRICSGPKGTVSW